MSRHDEIEDIMNQLRGVFGDESGERYAGTSNLHALKIVKEDGLALECIKVQNPEICLAAVRQNGLALQFVEEQTPEICLAAVASNHNAQSRRCFTV